MFFALWVIVRFHPSVAATAEGSEKDRRLE
jgi:hypothetical protein